jgi:hypothetical protein
MTSPSNVAHVSDRPWLDQPPFISTHRARAVCNRELARLVAEVARRVKALGVADATAAPVVRVSPDRYVVQLGPVALSLVWLRSGLDTVADGELLVIVWRGTIGPRRVPQLERRQMKPTETATVLWEEVITVVAENEPTWRWRPRDSDTAGFTSDALAERCVNQLQLAYDRAMAA